MKAPRVSIVILNWNGWVDTIECLESLYRITYSNYDVIVVDNGSKDDSIRRIKEYANGEIRVSSRFFEYAPSNKPIKVFEISEDNAREGRFNKPLYEKYDPDRRMILIKNKDNYGYVGGNNIGVKFAISVFNPDYILILNNDTVVDRDFLSELVRAAESNEKIGIVSPKIYYYRNSNRVQYCGIKFSLGIVHKRVYKSRKQLCKDNPPLIPTEEVHGACMLIKHDVLSVVGHLDEDYFAYWEETDFSIKARRVGFLLLTSSTSNIWHKVGNKNLLKKRIRPLSAYLFGRNMVLIVIKNYSGYSRLVNLLLILALKIPLLIFNYAILYRDKDAMIAFSLGILAIIKNERKKPKLFLDKFV